MTTERLELIKKSLEQFEIEYADANGTPQLILKKEDLIEVAKKLKHELEFDILVDILGVDRFTKENRFEVISNLYSNKNKDRLFLKVKLDSKKPECPSLTKVWKSANWYEREAYDMFGIIFTEHPDLRRIYMPDEFQYYPLRKDFPLIGIPGSLELPKKEEKN